MWNIHTQYKDTETTYPTSDHSATTPIHQITKLPSRPKPPPPLVLPRDPKQTNSSTYEEYTFDNGWKYHITLPVQMSNMTFSFTRCNISGYDMKTAQSVFYLRNHVLTMLLFLSKMIYVVSEKNHNLLLCSEKDLRNSQLGKFGILPTWGNHKASPKDQRPVFSSTNCEEPWTAVLHPQLHQQDIRPSSNLRELPPTLVCCLNTAATQPYPHLQKHQGH